MSNEVNIAFLANLIDKIIISLGRPSVQIQLLVLIASLLLAWLLSYGLRSWLKKEFLRAVELDLSQQKPFYWNYGLTLIRYLLSPLFSLLAVSLAKYLFFSQGWLAGILSAFISLLWTFLIYRLGLTWLYAVFSPASVRRYHYRLLAPLFALFVAHQILSQFTDLNQLARVVVINLFENPITLGAVFLATVGLYLWIDGVLGFQDALFQAIVKWTRVEAGVVQACLTLIRYGLIGFGIIVVFSYMGFDSTTFAAISGGLSVGIGFGLREMIGNFISGITLLFEKALKPGDFISVDGEISEVKRLTIRATTVRTFDNIEKIVPNQDFFTSSVITYTGSDRVVRLLIPVGVSYKSDPEEVIEILLNVAKEHPKVLREPKSVVFLIGFGDSSINFELAVWLNNPAFLKPVTSDLNRSIWKAFAEHEIEIPFPQRDLHIRSDK
ncbi:MAG: mechanosensitive ion channel family protein [Prochloraceae cyanobacterium]